MWSLIHTNSVNLDEIYDLNPGYFSWINQADFPLYTKNIMRDFADKMKQANEEVYGEKKEQYESLEGMISRMKRS